MKNGCTHVRKLTKFSVCDCLDHCRILYDSRICYKETGNVCPVLIKVCLDCFCNKGTSYIRTTSGESLNCSVFVCTVESRNNGTFAFCKSLGKKLVCLVCIKVSVLVKTNYCCCIYEFIAKVSCHYFTIEELTSGCSVIRTSLSLEVFLDLCKFFL